MHHPDHECECDCRQGRHGHRGHGHHHDGCQCGCHSFERRFQTKAEQVAELEAYLSDLKAEVQAVEERLADLR